MNAKEIRELPIRPDSGWDTDRKLFSQEEVQCFILRELTAQLAELNNNIVIYSEHYITFESSKL